MHCFELLGTVLDEVWEELVGTEAEKLAAIHQKEKELRESYRNLANGGTKIDYSHPATRYAYLACYVSSHANMVYEAIKGSDSLKELLKAENVKVACIGGGPGSDLLGVLKLVDKLDLNPKLKFFLYDAERNWSESWADIDDKVEKDLRIYVEQFDVTNRSTWEGKQKYLQADLFTMIYFASELHRSKVSAEPFFKHLADSAKPGALLLYVDNANKKFHGWVDEIFSQAGWEAHTSNDFMRVQIPSEEEKRALGDHYNRISGNPKLGAEIAMRIWKKGDT